MLVLSRRLGERVLFPDLQVAVKVLSIRHREVRLGFEAPTSVHVVREELIRDNQRRPAPEPDQPE